MTLVMISMSIYYLISVLFHMPAVKLWKRTVCLDHKSEHFETGFYYLAGSMYVSQGLNRGTFVSIAHQNS